MAHQQVLILVHMFKIFLDERQTIPHVIIKL